MLCELQFPEVVGNYHYEKLWNHLDKRELRDFGSTKRDKMMHMTVLGIHMTVTAKYIGY